MITILRQYTLKIKIKKKNKNVFLFKRDKKNTIGSAHKVGNYLGV